jgi:two-component system sensor histidine kinase TctE
MRYRRPGHREAVPTLRRRVAQHVLIPLVLTWALGTAAVLGVANYFAGVAFDRSLLDDAYAVAANVRQSADGLTFALSPAEMGTLLFDQSEQVFFAVLLPDGQLLAGHPGLRAASLVGNAPYAFGNIHFQGRDLRVVNLRRLQPEAFQVVMAQTSASRNRLLRTLLLYTVVPQLALLLLLAWWLRRGIQRDLQPLTELQSALGLRGADDLNPMPSSVSSDATTQDVQRLGLAINAMLERLSQSLVAQREFAGNIAHELRTPLAGIRAQASYALGHPDPQVWRDQLACIAEGEQRASHLIDQLLALALADEARTSLRLAAVPLNTLAREVLLRFLPKADAAGVDLGGEGLDDPVTVLANAALLEGILGNLLDNALRYGAARQPQVTVRVAIVSGAAVLSVTDNGPGLDLLAEQQLAQRWVLGAEGQRLGQGSGLGLSIVGRYTELLGARLRLSPGDDGRGLCASVLFSAASSSTTVHSISST